MGSAPTACGRLEPVAHLQAVGLPASRLTSSTRISAPGPAPRSWGAAPRERGRRRRGAAIRPVGAGRVTGGRQLTGGEVNGRVARRLPGGDVEAKLGVDALDVRDDDPPAADDGRGGPRGLGIGPVCPKPGRGGWVTRGRRRRVRVRPRPGDVLRFDVHVGRMRSSQPGSHQLAGPEHVHDRRDEHGADDEGVDEDGAAKPRPNSLMTSWPPKMNETNTRIMMSAPR